MKMAKRAPRRRAPGNRKNWMIPNLKKMIIKMRIFLKDNLMLNYLRM
jgi:hypothetical protein